MTDACTTMITGHAMDRDMDRAMDCDRKDVVGKDAVGKDVVGKDGGGCSVTARPDSPRPDALLHRVLEPLAEFYSNPATIEVRMGRARQLVTDRRGEGKRQLTAPDVTLAVMETICTALARRYGLAFDADTTPRLSCVLPGGHRFECLLGSSVQSGISLAVRCKHPFTPTWEQVGAGAATQAYLHAAVLAQRNMIISGATNTGKTTLLNMLLAIPGDERRIIAMEDTPELHLERFWDGVGLLADREASASSGLLPWRELYDHCNRITPDRVVFGEISTQNAFAALAALNSGGAGFMCTLHAESPEQAINRKFDQNIAWSGETMPRVPEFLSELVDVVVQIRRDADGWRRISDIFEPRNNIWILRNGEMPC